MKTTTAPDLTSPDPATSAKAEYLFIDGGQPLRGTVQVSGAKNAALPALAAACLSETPTTLLNMPMDLRDIRNMLELMRWSGARIDVTGPDSVRVDARNWQGGEPPADIVRRLRHSLLLLGVSAYRGRSLSLTAAGGCDIGERKHDLHVLALTSLGYALDCGPSHLSLNGSTGPGAGTCHFHYPSFGATLNFLLAALKRPGLSRLAGAAVNPEVLDVIALLQAMGAHIYWQEPRDLCVEGGHPLHGTDYQVMGDRIVAATYLAAAGTTGGEIAVSGVQGCHLECEIDVWRQAGLEIGKSGDVITARYRQRLQATDIVTASFPGFHTDIQPLHGVLMATAAGTSRIAETIVDGRFPYTAGLNQMGARIDVRPATFTCANGVPGQEAVITGVDLLQGADLTAPDIRGGGALVLAALGAQGRSRIGNLHQLDRGYANLAATLASLGAHIRRQRSDR